MERLTKKSKKDSTGYEPIKELVKKNNASPIIGKLGQLEDIEEKLGIDLITSSEALEIIKLVLNLNLTNRTMIKRAYEEGWITEEQFNLLKRVFTIY